MEGFGIPEVLLGLGVLETLDDEADVFTLDVFGTEDVLAGLEDRETLLALDELERCEEAGVLVALEVFVGLEVFFEELTVADDFAELDGHTAVEDRELYGFTDVLAELEGLAGVGDLDAEGLPVAEDFVDAADLWLVGDLFGAPGGPALARRFCCR